LLHFHPVFSEATEVALNSLRQTDASETTLHSLERLATEDVSFREAALLFSSSEASAQAKQSKAQSVLY
jgi:hypothetical protein